jgi:signal transduction histidine kinase
LTRLAAAARRAEEEERRRIGRELHDETAQSLLALRLELELLVKDCPPALASRIAAVRDGIDRNLMDLRRIIAALGPAIVERMGLEAALRQLAARFAKARPVKLRMHIGSLLPVSPAAAEAVYRVAQECLQNILRHSAPARVNLSCATADGKVSLRIVDDGAGFDAEAALRKPGSFGLAGMRERAVLLGGSLHVRSAPGKGASIRLQLPAASAGTVTNG